MPTMKGISSAFEILGAACVSGGPMTPERARLCAEVWRECLGDLDDVELLRCVRAHLSDERDCRFWPLPGQLLRHRSSVKALDLSPDIAWGQVLEEVHRRGFYAGAPPRWSPNEIIDAAFTAGVRAAGGWQAVCTMEADEAAARAATFRRAFQSVLDRGADGLPLLPEISPPTPRRIAGTFQQLGIAVPESWRGEADLHHPAIEEA